MRIAAPQRGKEGEGGKAVGLQGCFTFARLSASWPA